MRLKYILQTPGNGPGECVVEGTPYWPEMNADDQSVIEVANEAHKEMLVRHHGFKVVGQIEVKPKPAELGPINFAEMGRTELGQALVARGVFFDPQSGRDAMETAAQAWNEQMRGRRAPLSGPNMEGQFRGMVSSMIRGFSPNLSEDSVGVITDKVLQAIADGVDPEVAVRRALDQIQVPAPYVAASAGWTPTEAPPVAAAPAATVAQPTPRKETPRNPPRRVSEDDIRALDYRGLQALAEEHGIAFQPRTPKPVLCKALVNALAVSPVA